MSKSSMANIGNDSPIEEHYNVVELPSSVEVKASSICKGRPGAFCKAFIKKDTRFGPYKGEIIQPNQKADLECRYAWEVFEKKSNVLKFIISALDSKCGNWMRNVNSARFYEEQNILSVQEGFSIYYVAMKDIKPGEELLTWFDSKMLQRSERRQTRKERRQVGYTIELVPWSDEKKFVPEIIQTKRARKKKVLSDMISFDEDAPLVHRSLNSVLRMSKKKGIPTQQNMNIIPNGSQVFSNGPSRSFSNGFSDNRPEDHSRAIQLSSVSGNLAGTSVSTNPLGNSNYGESSQIGSHNVTTNEDGVKKTLQQTSRRVVGQKSGLSPHFPQRVKRASHSPREDKINALNSKEEGKPLGIFKSFDPSQLRPIVFRVRKNGTMEVEDHDEIYITSKLFKNQCDDLCLCLNKLDMLCGKVGSNSALSNCDGKEPKKTKDDLCIHFSLVPDDQTLISCNKIIYRCDICESAYNHAFSLKRHYLKIHINHRYLSKYDIMDCQIDTFHSGVETGEPNSLDETKDLHSCDIPSDASHCQQQKIPSLIELARKKLGLDKNIDHSKSFKEAKAESTITIPKILNVISLKKENEEEVLLPFIDMSPCARIDYNFSAEHDKQKETKAVAMHANSEHNEMTQDHTAKQLPNEPSNDAKSDSDLHIKMNTQILHENPTLEEMQTREGKETSQEKVARDETQTGERKQTLVENQTKEEKQMLVEMQTLKEKHTQEVVAIKEEPYDEDYQKSEISLVGHHSVKSYEKKSEKSEEKWPTHQIVPSGESGELERMDENQEAVSEIAVNQQAKVLPESHVKLEATADAQEQDMDWSPVISPEKEVDHPCQSPKVEPHQDDMESDPKFGKSDLDEPDQAGFHLKPAQQNLACDENVDISSKQNILLSDETKAASTECLNTEQVKSSVSVNEEPCKESVALVSVPPPLASSSSTKRLESTDAKKPSMQQQVILLVPVMSPTAPKPPVSKQSSASTSGPLAISSLPPAAGLAGAPPGAINLLSQSGLPMMVFSTGSSSTPLPLPPSVFLQSQKSIQKFASVGKLPGSECTTVLPSGSGSVPTFFISNSPKSAAVVTSQYNVSTLSTNLTSMSSKASLVQHSGGPNMYMSASYLTGSNENQQPSDLYRCHMCVLVFKTTSELKHHIKNDPHRFKGGVKQYACYQCSLRFRNKHNLNRHNMIHHHNREDAIDRKFRCLTCGKGFATENYLKMHARFHLGKSFPCKYGCEDVVFPNAASLVKHLRAVHPGLNLKEYIREKAMRERLKRHHANIDESTGQPPYSIYQPGIGFQAKRGRPRGSKNIKSLLNFSPTQQCSPQDGNTANRPKEIIVSQPTFSGMNFENTNTDIPRHRFMFKCKLCSLSFPIHLRLLQHRSKVHGCSQSVQEFLYIMSKGSTECSDSDHDSGVCCEFSPPPSPRSFFPNINFRGAENIKNFIDGGLESLQRYKKQELGRFMTDGDDMKPAAKLEWAHYNFPLCFEYRDDPTVFYDSANGAQLLPKTESVDPIKACELSTSTTVLEDKNEASQLPYDVCRKVISDLIDSVVPETSTENSEEARCTVDNTSKIASSSAESKENIEKAGPSICVDESETKLMSFEKSLDLNFALSSDRFEKKSEMDCVTPSIPQVPSAVEKDAYPALNETDSAYSSLSSGLSGSLETDHLSDQMLLNKMLSELEKHSLLSAKSTEPDGKSKTSGDVSKKHSSEDKFPFLKEKTSSPMTLLQKALCLETNGRLETSSHSKNEGTPKTGNIQLIKALDLPVKDIIGVVDRLSQTDYVSQWKKQRTFSSSSSCQRTHEHHNIDSVLNISDSSKHDHRRYSIWSRQHSHKAHSKNAELIYCPVVECVRKTLTMKEKASWKGNGAPAPAVKQPANQKRKEAFAKELGLMTKRDYKQSFHVKQQEIPCIKPPEIWKTYDKIWFGKKGTITVVCSMCHRHFSCLELCLRHQLKKHPHIEPLSLEMERGNYVEDMYYYYPMAYGILAHTQLIPDSMPPPELFVCTRCSFPFKNLNKLHSHILVCDPSQGKATGRGQSYRRKKLLPMMDRRIQNTTSVLRTDGTQPTLHGRPMQSSLPKSEIVKKGYVIAPAGKISLKHEVKATVKPATVPSSSANPSIFSFTSGHQRRHKFGLLYNPSNHTRRRELYQVLERHQCHGCNLKFKSMSLLERHVKKCSGKDKLRSQKPLLSGLGDDAALRKQHTCRYCNKRFTYIKGVDLHYKRICSVRKVKEEENNLTQEDLAHEAELQRIIEHMKWSKSLNKDSSDIILGHVRVEEDGTLIRVNKKRGRPHGRTKRVKKKGFKWTTLKRHRPDEDSAESSSHHSIATNNDVDESKTNDSQMSIGSVSPPIKGKSDVETRVTREETRKRKLSEQSVETPQQAPRKKGRPRKIRPVDTKPKIPMKRGRPRKIVSPQTEPEGNPQCQSQVASSPHLALDSKPKANSSSAPVVRSRGNPVKKREATRSGRSEPSTQVVVKPPTRKRGRPKKFDPSDMESSYKKKKHKQDNVVTPPVRKSGKYVLSKPEEVNVSKTNPSKVPKTEDKDKTLVLDDESYTSKEGKLNAVPSKNLGKMKKDIVTDKEAKSISFFETTDLHEFNSKRKSANDAVNAQLSPAQSKIVKISKVQIKTNKCEPRDPEKTKPENIEKADEKTPENHKPKDGQSKLKSPDPMSVSEELLKHLTCVISPKITSEAKTVSSAGNSGGQIINECDGKKPVKEAATISKTSTLIHKVVSPPTKHVKIIPLVASSQAQTMKTFSSAVVSSLKQQSTNDVREVQIVPSEVQVQQAVPGAGVSKGQATVSNTNSNLLIVAKSPPQNITVSSPSAKSQLKPVALRVITVPAGATQLSSSPSTIKLIKSSPIVASASASSKQSGEITCEVSTPVTSSTPPQLLSPVRVNPKPVVAAGSPSGAKPVTVIPSSGVLKNVSPSSSFPVVSGTNIQLPCAVKGNVSTASNIRLPQVLPGGIRLPQVIGTQLGSAVIVQPAAVLQGKTKVTVVPTNIRAPPSRFTCSTVSVKTGGVQTAAKIVKICNIGATSVEMKQVGTVATISPKVVPLMGINRDKVTGQVSKPTFQGQGEGTDQIQNPTQPGVGTETEPERNAAECQ